MAAVISGARTVFSIYKETPRSIMNNILGKAFAIQSISVASF